MSADTDDEKIARKLLRDQTMRVQLNEPLMVRSAPVTYAELRDDLVAHYQATGRRDVAEARWRIAHLDRAFRGTRGARSRARPSPSTSSPAGRRGGQRHTINRKVAILLRMLRLGLEHGKMARLPIVHKPKEAPPRAGFFEADASTRSGPGSRRICGWP